MLHGMELCATPTFKILIAVQITSLVEKSGPMPLPSLLKHLSTYALLQLWHVDGDIHHYNYPNSFPKALGGRCFDNKLIARFECKNIIFIV